MLIQLRLPLIGVENPLFWQFLSYYVSGKGIDSSLQIMILTWGNCPSATKEIVLATKVVTGKCPLFDNIGLLYVYHSYTRSINLLYYLIFLSTSTRKLPQAMYLSFCNKWVRACFLLRAWIPFSRKCLAASPPPSN